MEIKNILTTLQSRFEKNMIRHEGLEWPKISKKLESHPEKLRSLAEMEESGGEPDVIGYDSSSKEYIFCDCSPESPAGRRSICYDGEGQALREKEGINPKGNALDMAKKMGVELLTEDQYMELQSLGKFDTKTSSWVLTPPEIRKLGGGIYGDKRYNRTFIYHNGASSFYAARGFRGRLRV